MSKVVTISVIVAVVALFLTPSFRSVPSPIVTIDDGKLQGRVSFSRDGREYYEYLSIPYAEPPVGNLRFEPPVPVRKPWTDIKKATSYPPFCLQTDSIVRGRLYGVEDCLYLNVFTHGSEGKRPVMVFIHGGGFLTGSSNMYHPEFFMDEDVVIVTINYRLGPLGFMNLEDGKIRGNMGLKDQNLALKWVQKNIHKFGGDRDKVTIFGESAGAASVEYHLISPLSKGLFHRAVLQSGAVTCPWAFRYSPKEIAMQVIKDTECSKEKGDKLVQCLKQMDAVKLIESQLNMMNPTNPLIISVPSVETVVKEDTFLSENPRKILKSGKLASNVPVILGFSSGEGALRTARIDSMSEVIPQIDKDWENLAARSLYFDDTDISAEVAKTLRNKYFGSSSFTENLHEFKRNFSVMATEGIFVEPIQRAATLHAKHGAPTYMYCYEYEASSLPNLYSFFRAVRNDDWVFADGKVALACIVDMIKKWLQFEGPHEFGITHGADLLISWNMEGWTAKFAGPDDVKFSKLFVKMLVDFAKDTEPLKFDGVPWPAVSTSPPQYMLIDKHPKIIPQPFTEGVRFWENLKIRE